jgi:Lysine methyltransferase
MSSFALPCDDQDPRDVEEEEEHESFSLKNDQALLWKSLCDADERERLRKDDNSCNLHNYGSDRGDDSPDTSTFLLPKQQRLLDYNAFLHNQRYYDDLKHVDYRFIDFGTIARMYASESELSRYISPLIIEQDKSLGKGGFCWDAAFILGEYIASQLTSKLHERTDSCKTTLVELGCGTGLCGLYIARSLPANSAGTVVIHLTDMAGPIQELLQRNVRRIMDHEYEDELQEYVAQQYPSWNNPSTSADINAPDSVTVDASVLDWDDFAHPLQDSDSNDTYDIVFGSDVVATLYNPIHLANTIHCICHNQTTVYISFKERLSSIHDAFHTLIRTLFQQVNIISTQNISRNHNPDVYILIAQRKIELKRSS